MCIFIIKIFYNLIFIIINFSILTRLDHKLTIEEKRRIVEYELDLEEKNKHYQLPFLQMVYKNSLKKAVYEINHKLPFLLLFYLFIPK